MKKNISKIILLLLLIFPFSVKAAPTGSTSCSSSSTVTLNDTITVTVRGNSSDAMRDTMLSYDSSKLQYISGSGERNISDSFSTSITYSYKFRAIATGSAYVKTNSTVSDYYGEKGYFSSSCTINVVLSSGSSSSSSNKNQVKNSDNNLKSLSVEGATLTPEFNKDTLEYSVDLSSDTTKINIIAEKSDSKASIKGNGEIEVAEGPNKLEIVVTAENGSTKTYVINAIVAEKNPINVRVGGKKFTVIRKKDTLEAPEGYVETTVVINDEEVLAYSNEVTGYLLVGLTDSDGNSAWYIYDKDKSTYTKYTELSSNSIRLILLKPNKKDIPYKYYKNTFEYNGEMIDGYTFDSESDFRLIYGMNIDTGEKLFYVYDLKDKTLQKFYNAQVLIYIELVRKCKYLLLGLGTGFVVLFILLMISLYRNIKFKKKYISKVEDIRDNKKKTESQKQVKYKDIEATQVIDTKEEKTKKELKKQLNDEKKRLKKERKTFLDE